MRSHGWSLCCGKWHVNSIDFLNVSFYVQINTSLVDIANTEAAVKASGVDSLGDGYIQLDQNVVWTSRIHTKFVVNVDWSPCGTFLLTCSQDKSVALHRPKLSPLEMEVVTQLRFPDTPECAVFVPSASVPSDWLQTESSSATSEAEDRSVALAPFMVISLRGLSHLLYVNCHTLVSHKVALNEHEWDTHVSFTVLHLALSPCKRFLVAATDKDIHIVYRCGTNERMQVLAGGHSSDAYGRPKVSWDCTSSYIFCNSQGDNNLHVYSLCSGRIVGTLRHHTGQIRDIACHSTRRALLTASYDHSVAEWVH